MDLLKLLSSDYDPAESLTEQAAVWMGEAQIYVWLTTNLWLLWYQLPAYRETRRPALLIGSIASIIAVGLNVCDATVGRRGLADQNAWWAYVLGSEFSSAVVAVLGTVSGVLLIQEFRRLASAAPATPKGQSEAK